MLYEVGNGRHELIVADEGRSLPDDFSPGAPSKSLGMRVVRSLAKQLGGELTAGRRPDGGSCFKVSFSESHR